MSDEMAGDDRGPEYAGRTRVQADATRANAAIAGRSGGGGVGDSGAGSETRWALLAEPDMEEIDDTLWLGGQAAERHLARPILMDKPVTPPVSVPVARPTRVGAAAAAGTGQSDARDPDRTGAASGSSGMLSSSDTGSVASSGGDSDVRIATSAGRFAGEAEEEAGEAAEAVGLLTLESPAPRASDEASDGSEAWRPPVARLAGSSGATVSASAGGGSQTMAATGGAGAGRPGGAGTAAVVRSSVEMEAGVLPEMAGDLSGELL